MSFINRILDFLFGESGESRAQKIEEADAREEISDVTIFQRKILKAAFSERRGRGIIQVFALTFEDNFTDRAFELENEIRKYSESNNLFFRGGEFGYDDQQTVRLPPFSFPDIEVGEE